MYILFVYHSMLFTLCISVIETNNLGSTLEENHPDISGYPLLESDNSSTTTIKGIQLRDNCMDDIECFTHINNSECENAICQCRHGFRESKNKDDNNHDNKAYKACYPIDTNVKDKFKEETTTPTSPPEKSNGSHMLPIMIVLGIMFVGMCVALNLFSRAQFRNNRSLFSTNSHIVKTNTRSSSHRHTTSSHSSISGALATQQRANSNGSGYLGIESPSHPLETSIHTTICESSPIKTDRQQRTNRVLDNCISTTTKENVNLMVTRELKVMSTADVASSEAPTASSTQQ